MDRRSVRTSESGHAVADPRDDGLRHVAFFYRDQAERRARILGLVRAGLERGEPTFVALPGDETPLLAGQLDGEPGELLYADIGDVGRNPARLIPEVRAFIDKHANRRVLIVGDACWPGRSPAELREATRHEALMNLAFARSAATITCAYDATHLPPSAITDAAWTHPEYLASGQPVTAPSHRPAWGLPSDCNRPLPPPPAGAESLAYDTDLAPVRRLVERHARGPRSPLTASPTWSSRPARSPRTPSTTPVPAARSGYGSTRTKSSARYTTRDGSPIRSPGESGAARTAAATAFTWSTRCATWSRSGPDRRGPRSGCTCACRLSRNRRQAFV